MTLASIIDMLRNGTRIDCFRSISPFIAVDDQLARQIADYLEGFSQTRPK